MTRTRADSLSHENAWIRPSRLRMRRRDNGVVGEFLVMMWCGVVECRSGLLYRWKGKCFIEKIATIFLMKHITYLCV